MHPLSYFLIQCRYFLGILQRHSVSCPSNDRNMCLTPFVPTNGILSHLRVVSNEDDSTISNLPSKSQVSQTTEVYSTKIASCINLGAHGYSSKLQCLQPYNFTQTSSDVTHKQNLDYVCNFASLTCLCVTLVCVVVGP